MIVKIKDTTQDISTYRTISEQSFWLEIFCSYDHAHDFSRLPLLFGLAFKYLSTFSIVSDNDAYLYMWTVVVREK